MKLHEYQAKQILETIGVCIPKQFIVRSAEEACSAANYFGGQCVVKAQIYSGSRGKAGGIKICHSNKEVYQAVQEMLGKRLLTNQNDSEGQLISCLLVSDLVNIKREIYFSIAIDNEKNGYMIIVSDDGGEDIEEIAIRNPQSIIKTSIPYNLGIQDYHLKYLSDKLGLSDSVEKEFYKGITNMFGFFVQNDCTLLEINPLAISKDDQLIAIDAKMSFDDNAIFRYKIEYEEDKTQNNPLEVEAREIGLSYVKLDGNIACMVNGAGLAMATMDIIKAYGGEPANFMDVGGGVNSEKVTSAFQLIMKDPGVKAIFVNIFGGIAQCDIIAQGIVDAIKMTGLSIPLVVRLRGTHEEEGREILRKSGILIFSISNFTDAAKKVIQLANGERA